jgi:hypothetical protein
MTNYDETAGAEDPASLLEDLRQSIEAENDTSDLPEEPTDNERWGGEYLGKTTLTSSAVVSAAVDLMVQPQEPRPEARARMLEVAGQALAERRKLNGLLPVLLRTVREQTSKSLAEVATGAHLTEKAIQELETGDTEVNLHLPVRTVAAWIRALPVERGAALRSLRRSLEAGRTGELAPAGGTSDRPTNVDDYIAKVESELDAEADKDAR